MTSSKKSQENALYEFWGFDSFHLNQYQEKSIGDLMKSIFLGGLAFIAGTAAALSQIVLMPLAIGSLFLGEDIAKYACAASLYAAAFTLNCAAYDIKVMYETVATLSDKTVIAAANHFLKKPTSFGDFFRNSMNFLFGIAGVSLQKPGVTPKEDHSSDIEPTSPRV